MLPLSSPAGNFSLVFFQAFFISFKGGCYPGLFCVLSFGMLSSLCVLNNFHIVSSSQSLCRNSTVNKRLLPPYYFIIL